jgi:hypothetical protein
MQHSALAIAGILILAIVIIIVLIIWRAQYRREPMQQSIEGGDRSKLEARIIAIAEKIAGVPFKSSHPSWLRDSITGDILELDGYNEKLGVALEIQGPGHIKPIPGESYEKYIKRVERDAHKRKECARRGVKLIAIDYRISLAAMPSYVASRLFDDGAIAEKPGNYVAAVDMTPWMRGQ